MIVGSYIYRYNLNPNKKTSNNLHGSESEPSENSVKPLKHLHNYIGVKRK